MVTSEDVCCNKRNVKLNIFENLQHALFYNVFYRSLFDRVWHVAELKSN